MSRVIRWFAANGVAANLLMMLIILGGVFTLLTLRQEVFPEIDPNMITIRVPYPGAAPEEVEQAVIIRIEENIQDLEGIKEIRSTASENSGTVVVELFTGTDGQRVVNEIKNRVDAIDTFPDETEEPIIEEVVIRTQVINVAISGPADEKTLRRIAERVRDDLLALPDITQVQLSAARPYEISVEVSEEALRRYGLRLQEVADAIRRAALDLPGGRIETEGGEILLRTEGQVYRGPQFESLPLRTLPDGSRLLVGDVARVVDGFADTDQAARFDGQPAILVQVFRVGDQDAMTVADQVKEYIRRTRPTLPEGIQLTDWLDDTKVLRSRLDLLIRNGRAGLLLVFIVLALFLRLKLAGWVALGIPISFLGAIALMPALDVSVNLISLFAFIVVLGIVVDDAIVVGENIYTEYQRGRRGHDAAMAGATRVATPVIFAVLTTVAAFAPLLVVPGNIGQIMRVVPLIVIPTLLFSLVESLLVLPYHLTHATRHDKTSGSGWRGQWQKLQEGFSRGLEWLIERSYRPTLAGALEWRYLTLATAVALLTVTFATVRAGWIEFVFFPRVEADNVVALLEMPQGTPESATRRALERMEREALSLGRELEKEAGEPVLRHVLTSIGDQPFAASSRRDGSTVGQSFSASHLGEVNIELVPSEERQVSSAEVLRRWRERVGSVPDAVELSYTSNLFAMGDPIDVELSGPGVEELQVVAEKVKEELRTYPGVLDITDSHLAGKTELELDITPEAQAAGLTLADLARQARQAFYGEEAQRIQRGRDDVKVMVRLPEESRETVAGLESLRFRSPEGVEIPFASAATARLTRGPSTIRRTDRRRVINVTADVDEERANANKVLADLEAGPLPEILEEHPQVRYELAGDQEQQIETLTGLGRGFLFALVVIYGLLAIPFASYLQPLIVMSAIPFGLIGAVWGHLVMGLDLTILSGFGIVALTGVVVNDSLVMVDFINVEYRGGTPLHQAIREAGAARFRPILLTSLTTFAGLTPMLLERSVQAQFLIPMAVSLAFGVLFATFIILLLVPALYTIQEDFRALAIRIFGERARQPGRARERGSSTSGPRRWST